MKGDNVLFIEKHRERKEEESISEACSRFYALMEGLHTIIQHAEGEVFDIRNDHGAKIERKAWRNFTEEEKLEMISMSKETQRKLDYIIKDIIPPPPYKKPPS